MNGPLEWYASISGIGAAILVAGDFGRKQTGLGFAIFMTASVAWIASGITQGQMPLTIQNAILLLINAYGVWQYWLSPKNRAKIEAAEEAVAALEDDDDTGPNAGTAKVG